MRTSLAAGCTLLAIASATVAVSVSVTTAPAGAASGCTSLGLGGDWPSFGHDASNTRQQSSELTISPSNVGRLTKAWAWVPNDGGTSATINTTATEAGGCVFVGTGAGWVHALRLSDGTDVWKTFMPTTATGVGEAIVGAVNISGNRAYVLVNEAADGSGSGPYAAALDINTGALIWRSAPIDASVGSYTNASPMIFNGTLLAGWSPPEGVSTGQGGLALIDINTGAIVKKVYTIPPDRQAQGYAGGGIWTNPAIDSSGYAYAGTSNPYSKTKEDPDTNAILKIDVNRTRATFGKIMAVYKGNIDQYTATLQSLSTTAVCQESTAVFEGVFLDDPACGQLDLDFGASPNLFTVGGVQYVGDLQKAGVYHAVRTSDMTKKWATIVGTPCAVCNGSATATASGRVFGEGTLGGTAFSLSQSTGGYGWLSPVLDAIHYQSFSVANNVVYTVDSYGNLTAFGAATGLPLLRRPMLLDSQSAVVAPVGSSGVSIARNRVIATVGSIDVPGAPLPSQGYLVVYKLS